MILLNSYFFFEKVFFCAVVNKSVDFKNIACNIGLICKAIDFKLTVLNLIYRPMQNAYAPTVFNKTAIYRWVILHACLV